MGWWQHLRNGDDLDRQLDAELRDHIERLTADYVLAGMPEDDARRKARLEFGGLEQVKEVCRDARGLGPLDDAVRDARHALRSFARTPGFTAIAILTLALGIGATTATFSLVSAVLLRPLPYSNPDRLVHIVENVPAEESFTGRAVRMAAMNLSEVDWWRQHTSTLSYMAVTMPDTRTVRTQEGVVRLTGARVSPALFAMRHVLPVLGRGLLPEEERPDADVVVLSAATWQRYFGGAPDVLDQSMVLDGQLHTIVGVMPPAFGDQAFWTPFVAGPPRPGAVEVVQVTALLRQGVSLEAAAAEVNGLGRQLRGVDAQPGDPPRFEVVRALDAEVRTVRPVLHMLVAAVVALLLIVCANIANLLLVRGAARHREIAIRRALGAAPGRLVRQLLAESLVVSLAGGAAGVALAYAGVHFVRAVSVIEIPQQFRNALGPLGTTILPRAGEVSIEPVVLAFAFGLSIVTGIIVGLVPAFALAGSAGHRRSSRGATMQSQGLHPQRDGVPPRRSIPWRPWTRHRAGRIASGLAPAPPRNRVGQLLALVQLGCATMLLIASGLLVHSFIKLSTAPLGFDPGAQIFQLVSPGEYSRSRKVAVAHEVTERLHALPGVETAGFINVPPFAGQNIFRNLYLPSAWEDQREFLGDDDRTVVRGVSPGYLAALGVPLLEGRWLDARDGAGQLRVMLVSRGWVQRFSPDTSPLGTTVSFVTAGRERRRVTWEIVGVVEDIRWRMDGTSGTQSGPEFPLLGFMDLRQLLAESTGNRDLEQQPNMELDMLIGEPGGAAFAVRTRGAPLTPAALRRAIRDVDPAAGVDGLTTMGEVAGALIGRSRFYALMMSLFGAMAALVAAIGIYGVLAFSMSQRTQEFGIRIALGARPVEVLGLVLREGAALVVIGITLGLFGAIGLTRYLAALLFGLTPLDAPTYAVVAIAFAAVALLASYVPARRATKVDPLVALRCE